MTQFWVRIVVWSSLHEPVLMYGSFLVSVFELSSYWVHNEHKSRSPVTGPGLTERVRNAVTLDRTHEYTNINNTDDYSYIPKYTHVQVYTCTHTQYIHVHAFI